MSEAEKAAIKAVISAPSLFSFDEYLASLPLRWAPTDTERARWTLTRIASREYNMHIRVADIHLNVIFFLLCVTIKASHDQLQ